ncbi:MAG TPA: tRNA (adenosine(37)-N6)-threonylcarbamoyltransferase complex dimerization subunit type 1 TsaB [Pirellulales bacterium]|nr:tRNA (adenosine(37)-N6)-threonylcarbamoyltransferase complex dimerization subunit type 1 TsaB [Pirellulales bacterium]
MKILAIETSGQAGSVAVLEGGFVLRERLLPPTERSATTLTPAIRDILAEVEWNTSDVRLIAVTIGPGSFTGLRVGVTTAKTLAYALSAEVIGVGTLDVIAAQSGAVAGPISVCLDAQRQQVFVCEFLHGAAGLRAVGPPAILDNDAWIAGLKAGMAVTGPALEKLASQIPSNPIVVHTDRWSPKAATVGQVGWGRYQAGQRDDLRQLVPLYFRLSAAEEKLAARSATTALGAADTNPKR